MNVSQQTFDWIFFAIIIPFPAVLAWDLFRSRKSRFQNQPNITLYQDSRRMTRDPLSQSDAHDAPGLFGEPVPGVAAVVNDGGV